jgi:RecA-family ATPase
MTPFERAAKYANAVPAAISGQGGHNATFTLATALTHGFNLNESEAYQIMSDWNRGCQPPWADRELRHKIRSSINTPHPMYQRGYMLDGSTDIAPRKFMRENQTVTQSGKFKVNLGKAASESMAPATRITTKELLLNCFEPNEVICVTNEVGQDEDGRFFPASKGTFQTTQWWVDNYFGEREDELFRDKPQGAFIRINPIKQGDYSGRDDSVSIYRHVLVEFDSRPKEEQYAIFKQSNLPISALIDSGGKSIHAWVRIDAKDEPEWRDRRQAVFDYLSDYEPDAMTKNPSRWSRLGGIMRGSKEQTVLALNVGATSWNEWVSYLETSEVPEEISVDELQNYDTENDPTTVLGNRWLCRGGSLSIIGQSGIGKSSFLMQMAIMLAIGRDFFGIQVMKPYKCVVMQSENDTGDLAEAFKGVVSSMSLSDDEKTLLRTNIKFYRETVKVGEQFVKLARKLIVHNKADFFFADPLLSFAGGPLNEQAYASQFLRNWIQPVLMETGVVWVWLHHTGKPKDKESNAGATISDIAYSGLGSSELTNWSREVAVLRRTDKVRPFFELVLTKRGKRAGILDKDGRASCTLNLRHAEGRIRWEVNDENIRPNFGLKDWKKMEIMPPCQHMAQGESELVNYIARAMGIGHAAAMDVANHLIRLSPSNPIIIWNQSQQCWVGSKFQERGLDPY